MGYIEESVIVSEVSSFQRLKCMQEWYILGVGKGVLFREVSSVQECPHREREVPLYLQNRYLSLTATVVPCVFDSSSA